MEVSALADLVSKYGWSSALALLFIACLVWLFFALRRAAVAIWADLLPLMKQVVEKHIAFIDATSANTLRQSEAIEKLAEKIEQMGLVTKIDKINANIQTIVDRAAASGS